MSAPLLEADGIAKSFGERRVLTSAALRAEAGAVTGLLGRNGAGKSTLLKVVAGWIAPDAGRIRLGDAMHFRPTPAALAECGLFYLPDRALFSPAIPVLAQLEAVGRRFGTAHLIGEAAERLGVAERIHLRPVRLSGGEERRAEVAAALVRRPRCLLADEPYRGISPLDAERLTAAFRALAAGGCAVVVTGHEVRTLLDLVDRVVWCTSGTTHHYPSPAAALDDWQFQRGYLGWR
jgi:ABC-type multidrug transport system ATPase subunit